MSNIHYLRRGPVNPVFKNSRIPDFRFVDDPHQLSPANRARYEMYLERLAKVGIDRPDHEIRIAKGLRFKYRLRHPRVSKFWAPEQAGVQA